MNKAVEFLQQVEKLEKIIHNKLIEIEQWKALALSTTSVLSPDKVQSSGSKQKMSEAVDSYVDIENEINGYIDTLYDVKRDVLEKIEQLEALEYDILHRIYIQFQDFQKVADDYGQSKSWAYKHHTKAVKELEEILEKEKVQS